MLTKCTKLASFPGPFQHPIAKDFLFMRGESLGTRLHKASYTLESKLHRSLSLGY